PGVAPEPSAMEKRGEAGIPRPLPDVSAQPLASGGARADAALDLGALVVGAPGIRGDEPNRLVPQRGHPTDHQTGGDGPHPLAAELDAPATEHGVIEDPRRQEADSEIEEDPEAPGDFAEPAGQVDQRVDGQTQQ